MSRTAAVTRSDYWIDRALSGCVPSAATNLLHVSYIDELPTDAERDQWRRAAADTACMHDALVAEIKRLRALPVIEVCGDCSWIDVGRNECSHCDDDAARLSVDPLQPPPKTCPIRLRQVTR